MVLHSPLDGRPVYSAAKHGGHRNLCTGVHTGMWTVTVYICRRLTGNNIRPTGLLVVYWGTVMAAGTYPQATQTTGSWGFWGNTGPSDPPGGRRSIGEPLWRGR